MGIHYEYVVCRSTEVLQGEIINIISRFLVNFYDNYLNKLNHEYAHSKLKH